MLALLSVNKLFEFLNVYCVVSSPIQNYIRNNSNFIVVDYDLA